MKHRGTNNEQVGKMAQAVAKFFEKAGFLVFNL